MHNDDFASDAMHVAVPRAAGIDVHKMQVTVSVRLCVAGQAEAQVATRVFKTHPAALQAMTGWLAGLEVEAPTMEGTGVYWIVPYRAVERAGIRAELLHAQHVKQIKGRKTDIADSIWLARVCQFGLGRPSFVPSAEFQELREHCRYRRKVVEERTRVRNRVHKTIDCAGLRMGGVLSDVFGRNGRMVLDGLAAGREPAEILEGLTWHVRPKLERLAEVLTAELTPAALWRLARHLEDMDRLGQRLADIDWHVESGLEPWKRQLDLLETVPGVARPSARAILAEIGDAPLETFGNAARLAAWAGVAPGNNESAGKRRSGRALKGNSALRATLAECAHGAVRTKGTQFEAYHGHLKLRRGYKRAILAAAHKLLRVMWAVLRDDRPYRDPKVDYEKVFVRRNAPRWIRMLEKHGFLEEFKAQSAR